MSDHRVGVKPIWSPQEVMQRAGDRILYEGGWGAATQGWARYRPMVCLWGGYVYAGTDRGSGMGSLEGAASWPVPKTVEGAHRVARQITTHLRSDFADTLERAITAGLAFSVGLAGSDELDARMPATTKGWPATGVATTEPQPLPFLMDGWGVYRKRTTTCMRQIHGPDDLPARNDVRASPNGDGFHVVVDVVESVGMQWAPWGSWLALDSKGRAYPITEDEQAANYERVGTIETVRSVAS